MQTAIRARNNEPFRGENNAILIISADGDGVKCPMLGATFPYFNDVVLRPARGYQRTVSKRSGTKSIS